MTELAKWESFYAVVGSAAGALIGLQFVAMALIADRPVNRAKEAGAAFATPTIVHFCAALLLSALLLFPWQTITVVACLWGSLGLLGVVYSLIVIRRMRKQPVYRPVFEDWLFHAILPWAAYTALALSALASVSHALESLFGVAAAVLLLLFIGIHNAWDAVTYHVFTKQGDTSAGS